MMNAQQLFDRIAAAGYKPRRYSGRGMMGAECVGVNLDRTSAIVGLAFNLGADGGPDVPEPHTDSMGLGIVAYWPAFKFKDG